MKNWTIMICAAALLVTGCKGAEKTDDKAAKGGDKKEATAKEEAPAKEEKKADEPAAGESLPTETASIALDEGKSEIPATIDVPKGCTTFNDMPTTIRVDFGKSGELFGVQVSKGNEFSVNLEETAKGLKETKYGNTNTIVEQTDSLLVYTMKREDADANYKFTMLTKLGDTTWVCKQGNYGGWTKEQIARQMAACKTLKAK